MRAKPSRRRRPRSSRTLRIESLESRALLGGSGFADALSVTAANPPPVITLEAINTVIDVWDLEGTVTDNGKPVAGLKVDFGGVLANYHLTASVEDNGTYSVTKELRNLGRGTATAQTRAQDGKASNVAMTYIVNNHLSPTSNIAPTPALSDQSTENLYTLSTIAGLCRYSGDGQVAADASLNAPQGVAVDSLGDLFIADSGNNVIREIDPSTGLISTVAGNGICGDSGNGGAATSAELDAPTGVAIDAAGDLFIVDSGNNVIREVDQTTGVITTTVAGNGTDGYSGDGYAAISAQLNFPNAVAVDSAGNLFIADSGNNVIREVNLSTGVISTVAGTGVCGYGGDGYAATSAQLNYPMGVAVDTTGDLYIADSGNNVVREVDLSTGLITTVAGNYGLGSGYSGDGYAATAAQLSYPVGVAVGTTGDLFIADSANNVVRKVDLSTGVIQTVAGNGTCGYSGDGGAATLAELSDPTSIAMDAAGDLFLADSMHNAVREVDPSTGVISTLTGNGAGDYSGNGGAVTCAELYDPMGVAVDTAGNIFIADSNNNVIREVSLATGTISTVAGNGTWGYSGDGATATSAELNDPTGIALDAAGDLFIADSGNDVIREVNLASGVITTVAGNGTWGDSGDGFAATAAQLNDPTSVAVNGAGNLFIADSGNNVVREVDLSTGVISTVAGNATWGYSGDGYAATSAQLNDPTAVAVDAAGNLLIADTCNNAVRKVDLSSGVISTVAGTGTAGYGGDGYAATAAQLNNPTGVAVDSAGDLFIADSGNNVIRQVDRSTGVISTVAGTGTAGYCADGVTATSAQFNGPGGIAVDAAGNLFIADTCNNVVREVAQPLYWDPAGTGTEDGGGSGVWTTDSSDTYWYDPLLGTNVAWCNRSAAIFAGSAGTVTLDSPVSPISIAFAANDCLDLNGNSITADALGGSPSTITNNNPLSTSTLTVCQDINTAYYGNIQNGNGAVSFNMTGSGTFVAAGDNTYSIGTTVGSGTFVITTAAALADAPLTVGAGGTFIFDPSYTFTASTPGPQGADKMPSRQDERGMPLGDNTGATPVQDVAPVVTAVQCVQVGPNGQATGDQSLVDADTVAFSVSFNKFVTGVSSSDFTLDGDGVSGSVSSVSGSGYQYVVTVNGVTGSGTLGLVILADNTIADELGTPLAQTTIAVDQQYTIDRQLYWNPSANVVASGTATWDTGQNWRVGSPNGPQQGWCDGSDVFLVGTPMAIFVENPVVISSLTVLTDGFIVDGNTVSLGSAQTSIDVALGVFTVNAGLVGNALVEDGNGLLALGGINSYSYSTTVNGGELQFQNGSTLPATTTLVVNAGTVDLGGGTTDLTMVTLCGGSIADGTLQAQTSFVLYSGSVLADLAGPAAVQKLGPGTVVLAGHDTYQGGTSALAGTLVVIYADGLPGTATGSGTVLVQPTLYWSGQGDWTTGQWELANGTPTPWLDGASVAIATGSDLSLSGSVVVTSITVTGDATIGTVGGSGTITFPAWGGTIDVQAGTATIHTALAGSFAETGPGTVLLDGTLGCTAVTVVGGTLDALSALAAPPLLAGGQAIGPGAVFSGDESLAALDPAMFNFVQSLFVDQSIDRTDMIQILQSAVVDGAVTPTALAALEMLTTPQNEARLAMPAYVRVLASDVVNGNPANANYQGQPLGNLAQQTSPSAMATTLTLLVDKWFYGTDLPAIPAGLSYSAVAGPLYGDNPNPALQIPTSNDDEQGCLGDCYLIAALGAIADSSPAAIENMIIPNGVENGIASYTVRFYYQNNASGPFIADYVTVNALLPGWSNSSLVFAQPGPDGSYWMPIIEKAYAQWNESGREGRDGQNDYESLTGGCMNTVDEQVLGTVATTYSPVASDLATEQAVIAALQNHEAVTAAIFLSGDPDVFYQFGLVSCHAYEIASYDADPNSPTYQTFQLENPWGFYEPAPLTWSQLCAYGWIAVADTSSTVAPDSATAGASAATDAEARTAAFSSLGDQQHVPDAALLACWASNENRPTDGPAPDPRIRAVDSVLAMWGR